MQKINNKSKHRWGIPMVLCTFWGAISSFSCYAQHGNHKTIIQEFSKAYSQKTFEKIKPLLSPQFEVGIYDRKSEDFLLNSLTTYFACDSVRYRKELSAYEVEVTFYPTGKQEQDGKVTFDSIGLIRYVDLFDRLFRVDREGVSQLVKTIPFEEQNGSIILHCRINDTDRVLRLLFDTGADGMALSKELGVQLGLKVTRQNNASVVGGNVRIQVSDNNTVHIGDFAFPNQGIALFENYRKDTDGIIGNTLLKSYIVKVDYDKKELSLYTFGKYKMDEERGTTLPIELGGNLHLPISVGMRNGKEYSGQVYFDTGASYNLILFRPFVLKNRLLVDGFKPLLQGSTVSMGLSTPTFSGLAQHLDLGEQLHTGDFLITLMGGSGQNPNWNPNADGSLGTGIIGRYNFTINLLDKTIHFQPNSRSQLPADKLVGEYLLYYTLDGQLMAKNINAASAEQQGAVVLAVNGISTKDILISEKTRRQIGKALEGKTSKLMLKQGNGESVVTVDKSSTTLR